MRTWEFDDSRAIPTNLVLEQDFILRIRRLHRIAAPHLVANLLLSNIAADYKGRGTLDDVHIRLQALVLEQKGVCFIMTSGDVFLIWPSGTDDPSIFSEQALSSVLLEGGVTSDDFKKFVVLYKLPEEYGQLRERATYYVEESKASLTYEDSNSPARLLKSDAARGPLTAWSVNQIERLAREVDLRPFLRSQTVYEVASDKSWKPLYDESFMGLNEIKQTYFPHLDVGSPRHLFLELCQVLDLALLTLLMPNFDSQEDPDLSLNLALQTILGTAFVVFAHRLPRDIRHKVGFEIHCGDLLQDFAQTLSAFYTLRREGFKITIDSVTLDMLEYIHWHRFDVDYIKISVSKERAKMLKDRGIREAFDKVPLEKVVFLHCDSEEALAAGLELGVTKFQGWLIDEKACQRARV